MKIKPEQYARVLVDSLDEKINIKEVAENFWHILQKNKQSRDLPKILNLIDEEYAKKNNLILAKVYSEEKLSDKQLTEIKNRLPLLSKERLGEVKSNKNNFVIKNIIDKNSGGITIKIDDQVIDLSTETRLNNLKRIINIQKTN